MLFHTDNVDLLRKYAMQRLHYDPRTGVFTWRDGKKAGQRAGGYKASPGQKGEGYLRIKLLGRKYRTGRLAYLFCYGEWPPVTVDHKDRQRDNDSLFNLRPATHKEQAANSVRSNGI